MLLGIFLYCSSWIALGIISARSPSIGATCFFLFTGTFGLIFTDVMADTLVVERMKSERHKDVGSMQTLCWCMRFAGNLVGLTIGGIQMSAFGVVPVRNSVIFFITMFVLIFFTHRENIIRLKNKEESKTKIY